MEFESGFYLSISTSRNGAILFLHQAFDNPPDSKAKPRRLPPLYRPLFPSEPLKADYLHLPMYRHFGYILRTVDEMRFHLLDGHNRVVHLFATPPRLNANAKMLGPYRLTTISMGDYFVCSGQEWAQVTPQPPLPPPPTRSPWIDDDDEQQQPFWRFDWWWWAVIGVGVTAALGLVILAILVLVKMRRRRHHQRALMLGQGLAQKQTKRKRHSKKKKKGRQSPLWPVGNKPKPQLPKSSTPTTTTAAAKSSKLANTPTASSSSFTPPSKKVKKVAAKKSPKKRKGPK
jgi:hypothetical protein